jgi:hypothetical protein
MSEQLVLTLISPTQDPYHFRPDTLHLGVEGVSQFVQGKVDYMQYLLAHHEVYADLEQRADANILWTLQHLVEVLPDGLAQHVVTLLDLHAQLHNPLLGRQFAHFVPTRHCFEEVA